MARPQADEEYNAELYNEISRLCGVPRLCIERAICRIGCLCIQPSCADAEKPLTAAELGDASMVSAVTTGDKGEY